MDPPRATIEHATRARVFISYKRNVEPDQSLAREVFDRLQGRGHEVFIDQTLRVGQEWAQEIEVQVRQADYLVVFLTGSSSQSEMVRGEIEIARDQAARSGRKPIILPVRVAFAGDLPYPLRAYLDRIQYAMWRGAADTPSLLQELEDAVAGQGLKDSPSTLTSTPAGDMPHPAYAAPLPPPGGTLDIDDPRYVDRPSDTRALNLIRQTGATVTIKGPRQMGKSSLLVRSVAGALSVGKKAVLLDFQLLGHGVKANGDMFFRQFARSIAEHLELPDRVDDFWDAGLPNPQNCTRYVEREILRNIDGRVSLAIDEADTLSASDFRDDFFAMLRAWHNSRGNPLTRRWKTLDLILVTSTEPYLFITRNHESPFNVGETLRLADFAADQVQEMNRRHGSPLYPDEVDRLASLVGGHPYLTRKALYLVALGHLTPSTLFSEAIEDAGPFGDHLRNYLLRLHDKSDLVGALADVVHGRGCDNEMLSYRLEGAGLVRREGRKMVPRCLLYADYFRERLHPRG